MERLTRYAKHSFTAATLALLTACASTHKHVYEPLPSPAETKQTQAIKASAAMTRNFLEESEKRSQSSPEALQMFTDNIKKMICTKGAFRAHVEREFNTLAESIGNNLTFEKLTEMLPDCAEEEAPTPQAPHEP